jgi:undecaprenyl-diphosphatase
MDIISVIILAIIEGATEFLPVSSTGHLVLATSILNIPQTDFVKSLELSLQFGSILSVVISYWRLLLDWNILKRLAVAFVPTGIVGLVLYRVFKEVLLGNQQIVLGALLLGGVFIVLFELLYRERSTIDDLSRMPYKHCLIIGLCQIISIIPGVSRSAPTIIGGLALGMKRKTIVLFSFLLAVPTLIAASGFDLLNSAGAFSSSQVSILLIGFVTSFFVALAAIRLFLGYVAKNNFIPFGFYRIILVVTFYLFVIL